MGGRLEAKVYSNQWIVPSSSNPGKSYKVSVTPNGEWECSCPDWTFRRNECKHIKQVKNSVIGNDVSIGPGAVIEYVLPGRGTPLAAP